ncbi:TPM domain-containing protein [Luteolibacter algae]|uniref:TPM domain-containing protein n=1 Tax=Luteolibacter algae TaxID=454151 RepID=UPI0036D9F657
MFSLFLSLGATAEESLIDLAAQERPRDSIFDPGDILTPQERLDISLPLQGILANEGIDVLVVILPKLGDAPLEHVAESFAEKWGAAKINSVVLHVPGNPRTPWIFPGEIMSENVKPEILRETLDAAEKRAAAEPNDFGKIRAASIEAADALRYWTGNAILQSESLISARMEKRVEYDKRKRLLKIAAILGAAAAIPLIAGISFFILRLRKSGPRLFPAIRKTPRLGAPYSGGNSTLNH